MVRIETSQANKMKLVQDWAPYNESIIWEMTDTYYKNKGIQAFSMSTDNAVPHDINTNYQNAKAVAELLKVALAKYPADSRVNFIECGAGSGYFSLNFLHALRDIGIEDRVRFLISDYTSVNLQELKSLNIFEDFTEGENYDLVELDVFNPGAAKDLNGNAYDLGTVAGIVLNYVLDALPLTVLRRYRNPKMAGFEEMQIRIYQNADDKFDILNNATMLANFRREIRWQDYKIDQQSDSEKQYYDHLASYYKDADHNKFIPYCYSQIQACENLLGILDENGFVLSSDIPPGKASVYLPVGNATAHEVDNNFIGDYLLPQGISSKIHLGRQVSRLLLCKNQDSFAPVNKCFTEQYVDNNMINRYVDLRESLIQFQHRESADVMKMVLHEFEKLAKNSVYLGIYWGNYYGSLGETAKAIEAYKQARKLDYVNSYNLDSLIKNLEAKL